MRRLPLLSTTAVLCLDEDQVLLPYGVNCSALLLRPPSKPMVYFLLRVIRHGFFLGRRYSLLDGQALPVAYRQDATAFDLKFIIRLRTIIQASVGGDATDHAIGRYRGAKITRQNNHHPYDVAY
jgi:hypothetical protein